MDGMGPAINYLIVGASGHDLTIPSTLSADDELDDLMVRIHLTSITDPPLHTTTYYGSEFVFGPTISTEAISNPGR